MIINFFFLLFLVLGPLILIGGVISVFSFIPAIIKDRKDRNHCWIKRWSKFTLIVCFLFIAIKIFDILVAQNYSSFGHAYCGGIDPMFSGRCNWIREHPGKKERFCFLPNQWCVYK